MSHAPQFTQMLLLKHIPTALQRLEFVLMISLFL